MSKIFFAFIIQISCLQSIWAQSWPPIIWQQGCLGGQEVSNITSLSNDDIAVSIWRGADLILGSPSIPIHHSSAVCVYDSIGSLKWACNIGNSHFAKVFHDKKLPYYVVGFFQDSLILSDTILRTPGFWSLFEIAFDSAGKQMWVKTILPNIADNKLHSLSDIYDNYEFSADEHGQFYFSWVTSNPVTIKFQDSNYENISNLFCAFKYNGDQQWIKINEGNLGFALDIKNDMIYASKGRTLNKYRTDGSFLWNKKIDATRLVCDTFTNTFYAARGADKYLYVNQYTNEGDSISNIILRDEFVTSVFPIELVVSRNGCISAIINGFRPPDLGYKNDVLIYRPSDGRYWNLVFDEKYTAYENQHKGTVSFIACSNFKDRLYVGGSFNADKEILFRDTVIGNKGGLYIDCLDISKLPSAVNSKIIERVFPVFPNPARETITVTTMDGAKLDIIGSGGKIIKTVQSLGEITVIQIAEYPSGTYLVKIKEKDSVRYVKFIKE